MASALDKLYGVVDEEAAAADDAEALQKRKDSILPARVRAARKARAQVVESVASDEDPRITQYYNQVNSPATAGMPAAVKKRRNAALQEKFISSNPDLDPRRVGAELDPNSPAGQAESAYKALDSTLQQIVRMAVQGGPKAQMAGQMYQKVQAGVTPELAEKYNINMLIEEGVLKPPPGRGLALGIGDKISKGLSAADRARAVVAAGLKQGELALDDARNVGGHEKHSASWSEFKADVDKHIGFGDVYTQSLKRRAEAGDGTASPFGLPKAAGVGITLDKEGNADYDRVAGRGLAIGAGAGGDVVGDPTTYVGMGASKWAKAGDKALEAKGLGKIAKSIREAGGVKGLTEAEHSAARAAIEESLDDASAVVIKKGKASATDKIMGKLEKQGERGLKVGGRTVLPVTPGLRPSTKNAERALTRAESIASVADNISLDALDSGTVLKGAGDGVVHEWDAGAKRLVVEPKDSLIVDRLGTATHVGADEVHVGDKLFDGKGVVSAVSRDNKLTVKLSEGLDNFDVVPKYKAAQVAKADQAAKLRSAIESHALREQSKYDRAGKLSEIDDAAEKVTNAPKSTDSGGFGAAVDQKIPAEPGVHVVEDGNGGHYIGIRGDDGALKGYAMLTDDAVSMFESLAKDEKGIGQRLLKAADEAGLDVKSKLANSDFTDDGRKAALRYLSDRRAELAGEAKSKIRTTRSGVVKRTLDPDRARYKPDLHPSTAAATTPETFNVGVRTAGGHQTGRRLFRVRDGRHMVKEGWDIIAPRVDSAGSIIQEANPLELAKVVGWNSTPDGVRLIIDPTVTGHLDWAAKEIGDEIPEMAAVVTNKAGGKLELRSMTQTEYDAAKAAGVPEGFATRGAEKAPAAIDPLSAATVPPSASKSLLPPVEKELETLSLPADRTIRKPGLRDKIMGKVPNARAGLSPRANVAAAERVQALDAGTSRQLYSAQAAERAAIGNTTSDLAKRQQSIRNALLDEYGHGAKGRAKAQDLLSRALDVEQGGAGLAARLADEAEAAGEKKAAAALRTAIDLREEIAHIGMSAAEIANAIPPSQMPLITTHEGIKAMGEVPSLAVDVFGVDRALSSISPGFSWEKNAAGSTISIKSPDLIKTLKAIPQSELPAAITVTEDGFKLNMGKRVADLNEAFDSMISANVRQKLGMKEGEKLRLFHEAPLTAYAIRSHTAQGIAIQAETTLRLADEGVVHVVTTEAGQRAALADGLIPVPGWHSPIGKTYAPKEVAAEMNRMSAVMRNSDQLKSFKRTVDQATALWTRQVLSPLTKGFGYTMRNAMSNTINATFGGLNIAGQREANRLQMGVMRKAGKLMKEEGLSHEAALERLLAGNTRDATIIRYMREDNIMNSGLYRALDSLASVDDVTREGLRKHISPLSPNNVLFRPGRAVNTVVEDNARMALYISVFDSTGSREAAREAVAKYLFDYADLTPFESHVLKSANAFWTFTRKNTALQIKTFIDRPALAINTLKAKEALMDQSLEAAGQLYPGERKEGKAPVGGFLNKLVGPGVIGIDDPVTAAFQAIDPVVMTAYAGINAVHPGFTDNLPPSEQPSVQNIARGVLKNTAGAPAAVVTYWFEEATGTSIDGRPLDPGDTRKRLIDTIAPVWSQKDNVTSAFGVGDDTKQRTNIIRLLTGIAYYNRDGDKAHASLLWAMSRELELTITQMKEAGIDVPTITELRDAGLIPTAADLKKGKPTARTVELTPEQKKQAARDKIAGR